MLGFLCGIGIHFILKKYTVVENLRHVPYIFGVLKSVCISALVEQSNAVFQYGH